MLTIGVDLGKRKSQFCVLTEDGRVIVERKLPNRKEVVLKFLRCLPEANIQVGCETCINTYWLVEILEEAGIPIPAPHLWDPFCTTSARPGAVAGTAFTGGSTRTQNPPKAVILKGDGA